MSTTAKQLPVLKTTGQSLFYSLKNIGFLVRISWLWILVIAGMAGLIILLNYAASTSGSGRLMSDNAGISSAVGVLSLSRIEEPDTLLGMSLKTVFFAMIAVLVVAISTIAVRWHRRFLTGELPGWFTLGLGRQTLSYIGYMVAICVISGLAMAVVYVVIDVFTPAINSREATALVGVLIMAVVALLIFARLHLVLPGTALGDQRIALRYSFDRTRGNGLRIAGGFVLVFLLYLIPEAIMLFLLPETGGPSGIAVATFCLILAVHLFLFSVMLSYMSHCYGFFVPPPDDGDLED